MIHTIASDALSVEVSTVGAKIRQVRDDAGRGWLVDTGRPDRALIGTDVNFTSGTRGGWDDCIPSIDCETDPSADRTVADHGDFWFSDWACMAVGRDSISLRSDGIDHPLRIVKTMHVTESTLTVSATATNGGRAEYAFLVSGHPLFRWPADATIEIPGATDLVYAFGAPVGTPSSEKIEVSRERPPWSGKAFVRWAGITRARFVGRVDFLELQQDVTTAPWLGVCVNHNSWPEDDPGPDWIALEPTTSPTDSLRHAIRAGVARTLAPGDSFSWTTRLRIARDEAGY